MRNAVARRWPVFKALFITFVLSISATLYAGCSIPSLEPPECTQARVRVREFYSFHFGNDMRPSAENVRLRERFLTGNYASKLHDTGGSPAGIDLFTQAKDLPKAFRVGECSVVEAGKEVQFEIVLFWKDDTRSEQKVILANARYENNEWLIDSVGPKDR